MLVGRDPERRLIESVFADARDGRSGVLVIRGEAGIGKSALLEQAVESDFRMLRCTGVESESDLPFGALQQLLRPVDQLLEHLSEIQAAALRSALGLGAERAGDRLLLGLATLNILAEAAGEQPLLCLVDDLQWVDGPSSQALLFAARRLDAEGIVMLFAVRDDPTSWLEVSGLPEMTLTGLSDEAAKEVLLRRDGTRVPAQVADGLIRRAAGNPLALLELPIGDAPARGSGGVEAAFRTRARGLPADTRRLLLLAASSEGEETVLWHDLAALADVPPIAKTPAVDAGLIGDTDAVAFRHPLVRSAVQSEASRAESAEAHRLLAEASTDLLTQAFHLAAAADEPDPSVAARLEEAAAAAERRGAFGSAGDAFARAALLSLDPQERVRLLTRASEACLHAGQADKAATLAEEAIPSATDPIERAALLAVQGNLELLRGSPLRAYELFFEAATSIATVDAGLTLVFVGGAISAAFIAGWPERAFAEAHPLIQGLPTADTVEDRFLRPFLAGMAALAAGEPEEAKARLLEAAAIGRDVHDLRVIIWVGMASIYGGNIPAAREHYFRALATARAAGSFNFLPAALNALARLHVTLRAINDAGDCISEGIDLSEQLGQETLAVCFSGLLVRALSFRGEADACRELAEETLRRAQARGIGVAVVDTRLGLAELELALGNGIEARAQLEQLPPAQLSWARAPLLVRAALLAGDPEAAREAFQPLAAQAEHATDPYFLGLLARCRAQLETDPEAAETLYREALVLQQDSPPFDRASTELIYGESLRRAGRKTEARVQLRNALAVFEGLGAQLWADRARAELEATGITARKRDPSTLDTLTPQELRIARLVAAGASNRDVAAQLFLSPKTVEYHLRKVFLKLGVASRVELARLPFDPLAAGEAED